MTSDHNLDPVLMANLRGLGIPTPIPDGDTIWFDDLRVANTASLDADLLGILKVESDMGFEDEADAWLAVHAWRMLAQRRVATAIPLLIDLLIHADEDDDWSLEELPEVLASYGSKVADPLIQALLLEPPHAAETWGFVGVVDALKLIAIQNALVKESICEELRSGVLDFCDVFSPTVTAFVIMTFIELKYSPAIPAIDMAFRRDLVDQNIVTWKDVFSEFRPMVPEKLTPLNETRSLDSYSGGEWMDRNLMILGSQFRSDTLRFFLLGSILQVKMVSPNEQLNEVMTDFDGEEVAFTAGGQANSFVRNFMGLWNTLASYQDRLFELPTIRDLSEADEGDREHGGADLAMTKHVFWMCCFVDGLEFEDRSDASALSPEGRVLIDGIFEFLEESRRIPSGGATEQKRNLVNTLREVWARHYLALANSCRQARLMVLAKKKLVGENRHIGRNDPCPCGSGKKFKKCCLM